MEKRIVNVVVGQVETRRRRIEGKRPQRLLSHVTKSHAFSIVQSENRMQLDADFFFPLYDTSDTSFEFAAFADDGPDSCEDENKTHHPYFIKQMNLLVEAAIAANIPLAQQMFWSKSGKCMSLDDGHGVGVEPDFCMTAIGDVGSPVPIESKAVKPPQSKYDVTVAMEMKKAFVESDQMDALDYGERLLCFQRGRKCAYTALFHCCKKDKTIRWLKTEERNGHAGPIRKRAATASDHFDKVVSRTRARFPTDQGIGYE